MGKAGKIIGGAILFVGGVGVGVFTGNWAIGIAMMTHGVNLIYNAAQGERNLVEHQGAILENRSGARLGLPIIYGRTRVAPILADVRVDPASSNNKRLVIVAAFCQGSDGGEGVELLEELYLDDQLAWTDAGGVQAPFTATPDVTDALQTTHLRVDAFDGTDVQTNDPNLTSLFPTEWPVTSDGLHVCYMTLMLWFNPDIFPSGLPRINAVIRGQQVFDPRDSTTAYSQNPALAIRDYLTSTIYGFGIPEADIDDASFESAADFCDESVIPFSGASSQPRFQVNGWINPSRSLRSNLADLLTSCRGTVLNVGGVWKLLIRRVQTASGLALTTDNVVEGSWRYILAGSSTTPNRMIVNYIDTDRDYRVDSVMWPEPDQSNPFLTDDNSFLNEATIDLPLTDNRLRAQQIGMVLLRESREAIGVMVTAKEDMLQAEVGDIVTVTQPSPGFVVKPFWVVATNYRPHEGLVDMVLVEYEPSVYTLDEQFPQPTIPNTGLPDSFSIDPPTSLVLTAGDNESLVTQDGVRVARILMQWTPPVDPFLNHYEIQAKPTTDSVFDSYGTALATDAEFFVGPVTTVSWDVRVRAVNHLGVHSTFLAGTITPVLTSSVISSETVEVADTTARYRLRETDFTLPLGLWGLTLSGDVLRIEKNTAAGGDFSTLSTFTQWFADGSLYVGPLGSDVIEDDGLSFPGGNPRFRVSDTFGILISSDFGGQLEMFRSGGALGNNDFLGSLIFVGEDSGGNVDGASFFQSQAAEAWTASAHGTYMRWSTTPLGTVAEAEQMRLTSEGVLLIGRTTAIGTSDLGAASINLASDSLAFQTMQTYHASNNTLFALRTARGTEASPTAVQADDVLGDLSFDGRDDAAATVGAVIQGVANENWTGSAHGSRLGFFTKLDGSVSILERWRVADYGALLANQLGTAALPPIARIGDPDTGVYWVGTNQLGLTAGGLQMLRVVNAATDYVITNVRLQVSGGSEALPSISPNSATDHGIWFTPSTIRLVIGASERWQLAADGDMILNNLGNFANDGTIVPITDDVLRFTGTQWVPSALQFRFTDGDVVAQAFTDGTAAALVDTSPSLDDTPAPVAPSAAPVLIAGYKTIIVDMSAHTLGADKIFVVQWSTDSGSTWSDAGGDEIVSSGNKVVHTKLLIDGTTYRYRVRERGSTTSAASPETADLAPLSIPDVTPLNIILASQIAVVDLAAISANIGVITAGQIRNAANTFGLLISGSPVPATWTRFINFSVTSDNFIETERFQVHHDGSITISDGTNTLFSIDTAGTTSFWQDAGATHGILIEGTAVPGAWTRFINLAVESDNFIETERFQVHHDGSITITDGTTTLFNINTAGTTAWWQNSTADAGILLAGTRPGGWTTFLDLTPSGGLLIDGAIDISLAGNSQGLQDFHIVLRDTVDVAHGMTAIVETDVLGGIGAITDAGGGLRILGLSDAQLTGLHLEGIADTEGSTSDDAAVKITGWRSNGTGRQAMTATGYVFQFANATDVLFDSQGWGTTFRRGLGFTALSVTLSSDTNNWDPWTVGGNVVVIRLTASVAGVDITGLLPVADNRLVVIINVGTNTFSLQNEDTASTTANRFTLSSGGNGVNVNADESVMIWYDTVDNRWRDIGSSMVTPGAF